MPAVHGGVSEETDEFIEWLVESGRYESKSEAVEALLKYALYNKYGFEE